MADISSLVSDIYELFNKKIEHIDIGVSHEIRDEAPTLRMSILGKPLRQLYYELKNFPREELSGQTKFKFQYGHILEDVILELAEKAGHEVKDRQRELVIDGVVGHIDAVIDGVLVDVKSCSPYSFSKFKDSTLRGNDSFGYIYQLSAYWAALPEITRAGFLAINKVSGELCFMELKEDERKTEASIRDRITQVREAVDSDVEPSRCYEPVPVSKSDRSGNLVLNVPCSYCPSKYFCWRDSNNGDGLKAYHYSTGVKWFVEVRKEPRVNKIEEFPIKNAI